MADPEFWRRAENKFRRLQTPPPKPGEVQRDSHNGLCAWWAPNGWDDGKAYHFFDDGHDHEANSNIERLFWYAADSAGVELGYPEGEVAVFAWLDRLRLAGLYITPGTLPGSTIIYRVCDASAEYCVKCETEAKAAAREARTQERGSGQERINENARESQDSSDRPLGNNPFPESHPVHAAFEEAAWKAKTKIAPFKLEFLETGFNNAAEFIPALLTFRKRWFSATAFEATLIVGNEETAQWYEHWIDDHAKWLLADTLSQARRKDPKADPAAPPFFSSDDIERIESELKLELMRMVEHYKGVAAARVVEVIGLRNAAQAAAAAESEGVASGRVSPAQPNQDSPVDGPRFQGIEKEGSDRLPELPPKFQNAFEAAKANAELDLAKLARTAHPFLFEISRLKLIQDVLFAYCTQARAACRSGNMTVAQVRQATEAALPVICDFYFVRDHGTSSNDAKLTFRTHFTQGVANESQWHQHLSELAELAEEAAKEPESPRSASSSLKLNDWQDLEIRFLSDERIQVSVGQLTETRNYAEFGFEDRRTKKPTFAWMTLRALAQKQGTLRQAVNGQDWSSVEKRIQEIRRVFRKHFKLDGDPIPYVDGTGYKASFKINCAPSFES